MRSRFLLQMAVLSAYTLAGCGGPSSSGSELHTRTDPEQIGTSQEENDPRNHLQHIHIFSKNFYPEGVALSANGTFYIGSFGTGEIARLSVGQTKPETFVPPSGRAVAGLSVDEASSTLWACDMDLLHGTASRLLAFELLTGAPKGSYPLPPGGGCNDLTLDASGNVYLTDTFLGVIRRLPKGGSQLEAWASDPERFMAPPGTPGLNGIDRDGTNLYVVKHDDGGLFRVDIQADGSAGAITSITPDVPLGSPDGVRVLASGSLLVTDNASGKLNLLELSGDTGSVRVIAKKLDQPTTLVVYDGGAYVVESQLDHYLGSDPKPPKLPFTVQRIRLH